MFKPLLCTVAALSLLVAPVLAKDTATEAGNSNCKYKMSKACAKSCKKSSKDVIDVSMKSGQYKTFNKAVEAAGLTETLKTSENITVFAPTDKAFDALPKEQLESLLKPENKETLRKILTYHVVAQELTQKDLKSQEALTTLEGNSLKISQEGSKTLVNGANLVKSAVMAKNGVIQGIDKVLIP
jgi:uncharacterized surface protein with fasciclin (FAS1) repeats